ncbi:hypothetical protein JL722_12869 [Aureococcus anophagefferens]|nr:hypothetical protein JL722_12869 [Aureococcus anophagefferens]
MSLFAACRAPPPQPVVDAPPPPRRRASSSGRTRSLDESSAAAKAPPAATSPGISRVDVLCECLSLYAVLTGAAWVVARRWLGWTHAECLALRRLRAGDPLALDPGGRALRLPFAAVSTVAVLRTCWRHREPAPLAVAHAAALCAAQLCGLAWAVAVSCLGAKKRELKWLLRAHEFGGEPAAALLLALASLVRRAAVHRPWRRPARFRGVKRKMGYTAGSLVPLSIVLSWDFWRGRGEDEGAAVGAADGLAVGAADGKDEGAAVGAPLGRADGSEVEGIGVGSMVGSALGAALGAALGSELGLADGLADGLAVGAADGVDDGAADGVDEGAALGAADGKDEGAAVGAADGLALGAALGKELGLELGAPLGNEDGQEEGDGVGTCASASDQQKIAQRSHREVALTLLRAGAAITALRAAWITPENKALHDYMIDVLHDGGWNARVERHRRPLMSILSNLALPHDALRVVLSFWSPPGGR